MQSKLFYKVLFINILMLFNYSIEANGLYSQDIDQVFIELSLQEVTVLTFIESIEDQTDYNFVYTDKVSNLSQRFTLVQNKISLKNALEQLYEKARIVYKVTGKTIALNTTSTFNTPVKVQNLVSGSVFQSNGLPLPGANVVVMRTNKGAITDFDGKFSIQATIGDMLRISYVGFADKEVEIKDTDELTIILEDDINTLEQIVVIGYGTSTKKELTTAISSVESSEILEDKPFVNVEQSLVGKVAGVQVLAKSGSPGDQTSVRIRGISSINAGNEPLYIIDGAQVNNTEGLNPNDIESISILKDAASSSIYGARASNGVVIITTKRGKSGVSKINFSTYFGQNQLINTLDVLNSQQYLNYINTALLNAGEPIVSDPRNLAFNTDWQKELYDNAFLQNYQISFSGGNEKGNFYLSAGYQEEEGTIETTGFERYSLRFNQDRFIKGNFKVGNSIALSRTNFNIINDNQSVNQGGVVLSALQTPPILPVQEDDGSFPDNPFQPGLDNPIALIQGEERAFKTTKGIFNLYGSYDFTFGLQLKSSLSLDYNNSKFNRFLDPFTTSNGRAQNGEAQNQTFFETVWLWENTATYKAELFDAFNFELLIGTSAQRSRYEETNTLGRGFANGAIPTVEAAETIITGEDRVEEWANNSLFSRMNVNYLKRYYLSSSIRRDGSSRFGPDNLYGLFPSISFSWLASNESFLENLTWLSSLKLRYSYGSTGNQFIGNYAWRGLFESGRNYVFDGNTTSGFAQVQIENQNLKWETTTEHNIGFDLSLFKNKISFTADVFNKDISDGLLNLQLPITTGFDSATFNLGEFNNRGVELALDANIITSQDFNWNMNANYSQIDNTIKNLDDNVFVGGNINILGNVVRIEEDQPFGNFYGFVAQGIDPDTGNVIFADLDNNLVINENDRTIIGNALPDFTWGYTNTLRYKGFELIAFFQGVEGQDIFNATRFSIENQLSYSNQGISVLDRWTPENREGSLPIAVLGDPDGNSRTSTRWVEDGSYIKLREVTLSYTFPSRWIKKMKVSNLKIYTQGRNLYTWTDYTGYDPEVNSQVRDPLAQNIDYGTYPQVKTFIAGMNISF